MKVVQRVTNLATSPSYFANTRAIVCSLTLLFHVALISTRQQSLWCPQLTTSANISLDRSQEPVRHNCEEVLSRDHSLLGVSNQTKVTFIHIPKTGGSTIESVLRDHDIFVGEAQRQNWSGDIENFPYPVTEDSKDCVGWHRPPSGPIDNSFTIVRDPVDRLESEFKYRQFKDAKGNLYSQDQRGFESWIKAVLEQAESQPFLLDCHYVPQYDFARQASLVVPYECYDVLFKQLPALYGIESDLPIKRVYTSKLRENWAKKISTETRSVITRFFAVDYAHLGHMFDVFQDT